MVPFANGQRREIGITFASVRQPILLPVFIAFV